MENNDSIQTDINNVTFREGYTFEFNIDELSITAHGSAWSGKETVSCNGEVVVTNRSYSRKSVLEFTVENDKYEVEFNMVSMRRGELHCTLIKNGVHVKTAKKALATKYQLSTKSSWHTFALFFLGGFAGYTAFSILFEIFGK